jgi:outer membrane immunogenic protein
MAHKKGIGGLCAYEIFLLTTLPRVNKTGHMKRITLAFAILCAACALTFAGPEELPSGKEMVAQPIVETCCFDGWYFGIHGGGILSNLDMDTSADEESLGADDNGFVSASDRSHGNDDEFAVEGGLHAGYNWCHGGWVFGLEVDLSASGLDENDRAFAIVDLPNEFIPFTTTVHSKATVDWYSTLRPRFGHTLGSRVLVYVTGGLAFGMAELREDTGIFSARDNGEFQFFDANGGVDNDRGVKFGWTGGGGIDFCITRHVILGFTYLYVDLEDTHTGQSFSFIGSGPPRTFDVESRSSSENNFHVFQGNLSFKF